MKRVPFYYTRQQSIVLFSLPRHPEPKLRPSFSKVVEYLSVADEVLLEWCNKDQEVSDMVTELGAPLSEGLHLYPELQRSFNVSSPI